MSGNAGGTPGTSQFSMPGGAASQFSMPGGQIPQYQGTSMLPATLGGAQGVQDAQNWTQAVQQYGGGMTPANLQQMAQGLGAGAGNLQAQQPQRPPQAPAGARPAQMGNINFMPGQLNLQQPGMAAANPTNSLLQLLASANTGYRF